MIFIKKILKNTIQIKDEKIFLDDMIADMLNNQNRNKIINELFVSGRKINIPLVFLTQSYFKVPKDDE